MMAKSPWPAIHTERKSLADDLGSLPDTRWDTPSLCDGWTVRQVLAHMTATAEITPLSFLPKLAGSGFSLTKLSHKDVAERMGGSPADTLKRFESTITSSKHPPGPVDTWLGEVIIHSEDIRRPLGIKHEYPVEQSIRVADFYKKSNLVVGAKKRIAGLELKATDADWSTGSGAEVSGPIVSLILAMTGRKDALKDLSGPGVPTLESRM
jgi:uncharacterized protein (TIGR03083 family)